MAPRPTLPINFQGFSNPPREEHPERKYAQDIIVTATRDELRTHNGRYEHESDENRRDCSEEEQKQLPSLVAVARETRPFWYHVCCPQRCSAVSPTCVRLLALTSV